MVHDDNCHYDDPDKWMKGLTHMAFDCHFVPNYFVYEQVQKLLYDDADFVQDNYIYFKETVEKK
jgi:hypothetical protein